MRAVYNMVVIVVDLFLIKNIVQNLFAMNTGFLYKNDLQSHCVCTQNSYLYTVEKIESVAV